MQVSRHAVRHTSWRWAAAGLPGRERPFGVLFAQNPSLSHGRTRGLAASRLLLATDTSAAAGAGSVSADKADGSKASEKKEEPAGMGWGQFFLYVIGGISGVTFFYYFYKAEYSITKTEVLMLQAFRRLPLYWPPQPKAAAEHSEIKAEGLGQEFVVAFTEWFILIDLQQSEGVTRDDVLELIEEFGIHEEDKVCRPIVRRYLEPGDGSLEERKRLTGVGLQESITFLAELFHAPPPKPDKKSVEEERRIDPALDDRHVTSDEYVEAHKDKGLDDDQLRERWQKLALVPLVLPREHMGAEAVELMRKKVRGMASISTGAAALRQAVHLPGAVSSPTTEILQAGTGAETVGLAGSLRPTALTPTVDDSDVDEVQEMQSEVARLQRMEASLIGRLERMGALSPAEESRLADVRRNSQDLTAKLAQASR